MKTGDTFSGAKLEMDQELNAVVLPNGSIQLEWDSTAGKIDSTGN